MGQEGNNVNIVVANDKKSSKKALFAKLKNRLQFFGISLVIIVLLMTSIVTITIAIRKVLKNDSDGVAVAVSDLDTVRYIEIDGGYIKDKLVVETNSVLPTVNQYFSDGYELKDNYTINYYDGENELQVDDFTYQNGDETFVMGIRTIGVIINNGEELETTLVIKDSLPPDVNIQPVTITEGDELNPRSFVLSYVDNSQLNDYTIDIYCDEDYSLPGEHVVSLVICDMGGNCIDRSTTLTVNEPAAPVNPPSGGGNGGSHGGNGGSSGGNGGNNSSGGGKNNGNNQGNNQGSSGGTGGSGGNHLVTTCDVSGVEAYKVDNYIGQYASGTPSGNVVDKKYYYKVDVRHEVHHGATLDVKATFYVNVYENGASVVDINSVREFYTINESGYKARTVDLRQEAIAAYNSELNDISSVFYLTNALRKRNGIAELQADDLLSTAAEIRAMEMAYGNKYSHTRPDGSCRPGEDFMSVLKELTNLHAGNFSENITYGSTAQAAFQSWLGSSSHYNAMVNTTYKKIGIGKFTYAGTTYWVQIFST